MQNWAFRSAEGREGRRQTIGRFGKGDQLRVERALSCDISPLWVQTDQQEKARPASDRPRMKRSFESESAWGFGADRRDDFCRA